MAIGALLALIGLILAILAMLGAVGNPMLVWWLFILAFAAILLMGAFPAWWPWRKG